MILFHIQIIPAECCHYVVANPLNFPLQINKFVPICPLYIAITKDDGKLKEIFLLFLECMEILFLKESSKPFNVSRLFPSVL